MLTMESKIIINNEKVELTVLMSTYNGSKYIEQQLESLINQVGVIINLIVRDDGSQDNTVSILEKYKSKFNTLTIYAEKNVGATASFYKLLKYALSAKKTEYYAYCDQDDIWLENKLIVGIKNIENFDKSKPNLYFSNLMMMNNDGQLLGMLLDDKAISCNRSNALASIGTYGCTCIFNHVALEKISALNEVSHYIYHDNWTYSVCVFLGNVYYDSNSYIRYRQTGQNVSGTKKTGIANWINRISKLFKLKEDKRIYESIAFNLKELFDDELSDDDRVLLNQICTYRENFKNKVKLVFSKKMRTDRFSKNVCIIGRILLGVL